MVLKMSFCIILSYLNLYKGLVFYIVKIYCNCMYFSLGCSGVSNIVFFGYCWIVFGCELFVDLFV